MSIFFLDPLFWLEGKTSFTAPQGGTISVKGLYASFVFVSNGIPLCSKQ